MENTNWHRCVETLRAFSRLPELQASAFFSEYGGLIRERLTRPEIYAFPDARPRLQAFVRVAQWNIEKGRKLERILRLFKTHDLLSWADVILLNEADDGMARSGNRHVALELARALGMHVAFGPAHIELTKGTGEDLLSAGENLESLQGNAILSRYPILEARIVPLPVCFEPFHFQEKRYGRRNSVWALIQFQDAPWWMGSVHLEVRDRPTCRARQMRDLLAALPGNAEATYLLGGDLNSNGFERGTRWRTFQSVPRLTVGDRQRIEQTLLRPQLGAEPLFEIAREAGFHWVDLNSDAPTARARLDGLEDAAHLPGIIRRAVERRLEAYHGFLHLKLDWLLGRGCRGLAKGELRDEQSGVLSIEPCCIPSCEERDPISDHLPICADLVPDTPVSRSLDAK